MLSIKSAKIITLVYLDALKEAFKSLPCIGYFLILVGTTAECKPALKQYWSTFLHVRGAFAFYETVLRVQKLVSNRLCQAVAAEDRDKFHGYHLTKVLVVLAIAATSHD